MLLLLPQMTAAERASTLCCWTAMARENELCCDKKESVKDLGFVFY
jgi:hypothetical protein